jgi:hypothetical protein
MPKSRKRHSVKKRRGNSRFGRRTEISSFIERIGLDPNAEIPYPVLYHYSSFEGALAILKSQVFWATAHDCTNDKGELTSANEIVRTIVKSFQENSTGVTARVLELFLQRFDNEAIATIRTAYLCCFSAERDDQNQWADYGANGAGVCLGLRVINEPPPRFQNVFSRIYKVIYSEDELRKWFSETLEKTCALLNRSIVTNNNIRLGLSTIQGFAAYASLITKTANWAREKELRHVTMDRFEPGVTPSVRKGPEGKDIRYLPVSLRANGKLIAFDEIIIGGQRNFEESRNQFETELRSKGYVKGSIEYPRITQSQSRS